MLELLSKILACPVGQDLPNEIMSEVATLSSIQVQRLYDMVRVGRRVK